MSDELERIAAALWAAGCREDHDVRLGYANSVATALTGQGQMSDIVRRLRNPQWIYTPFVAKAELDEEQAIADMKEAADEIERLRASAQHTQVERMWCLACGTVSRDGSCDCKFTPNAEPRWVNYADELQRNVQELAEENRKLLALNTTQGTDDGR